MEAWDTPEAYRDLLKLIPYKRIGEPIEIGRAAESEIREWNGCSNPVGGGQGRKIDAGLGLPVTNALDEQPLAALCSAMNPKDQGGEL